MPVSRHLSDDLLLDYATGAQAEAWSVAVASHMALCPKCRAANTILDTLGGGVLDALAPAALAPDALDAILAKLEGQPQPEKEKRPAAAMSSILPAPLVHYVGNDLSQITWSPMGGGVRQHVLTTSGKATARLLAISPGDKVPEHTHTGRELTLVLQGSVIDGDAELKRGDVQEIDGSVTHTPVAGPGDTCICLVVLEGRLRFSRVLPRIAQRISGV